MSLINKIILFCLFFLFFFHSPIVYAGQAECDPCGYCQSEKPARWGDCVKCLYDTQDPSSINTREVNDKGEFTSPPIPGHYFTQIGCIKTELIKSPGDVFANPGVVGGIANLILNRLLFPLAGILSLLYLIYGSFLLMTSQDDPQKKAIGKKTVTGAIFGLIFTLLSVFTLSFIAADILKIPGFTTGAKINYGINGSYSLVNGKQVYPKSEVVFKNTVTGTERTIMNYDEVKDFNFSPIIYTGAYQLKENEQVVIRYLNDHCPGCNCTPNCNPATNSSCCDSVNDPSSIACQNNPCNPPPGDRNLFVKTLIVDGKKCIKFNYYRNQSNDSRDYTLNGNVYESTTFDTNQPYTKEFIGMYWRGDLTCIQWEE